MTAPLLFPQDRPGEGQRRASIDNPSDPPKDRGRMKVRCDSRHQTDQISIPWPRNPPLILTIQYQRGYFGQLNEDIRPLTGRGNRNNGNLIRMVVGESQKYRKFLLSNITSKIFKLESCATNRIEDHEKFFPTCTYLLYLSFKKAEISSLLGRITPIQWLMSEKDT